MDQPVALTTKTLLVLLLAVVLLSGGVAVVAAQLSLPASAGAQGRAKGETRELKKLNRSLTKTNRTLTEIQGAISSPQDAAAQSLRQNTRETADRVQKLCRVIAEFASEC
jgi:TolA-binding protein